MSNHGKGKATELVLLEELIEVEIQQLKDQTEMGFEDEVLQQSDNTAIVIG